MVRVRSFSFDRLDRAVSVRSDGSSGNRLLTPDKFISLPEHEYVPEACDAEVLATFEAMTAALRAQFSERREYPNACIMPWFSVSNNQYESIDFMLAWGDSVEYPHPRQHKVHEYFRPLQRIVANRRGHALIRESLDAHGLLGRLQKVDGQPQVTIVSRFDQTGRYVLSRYEIPELPSSDHIELAVDMANMTPLRFHMGVQYNPGNGYIGNVIYQDDESRMLDKLSGNQLL